MNPEFHAQHQELSLSECERLCCKHSRDVEQLAFASGHRGMPGQPLRVPVNTAFDMLVRSVFQSFGVEPNSMVEYMPGLRNEALLMLSENTSNWNWNGPANEQQAFWNQLYGDSSAVRRRTAPLLRCHLNPTIRRLRFHSQNDVECVTNEQLGLPQDPRTPLFVIDAHDLAERLRSACASPLFNAAVREIAY